MFIKSVQVENFKCFSDVSDPIELKLPDGKTPGSGLNILVGENGTGKTTFLEAINFLTESKYSIQNRLSINDFCKGEANEISVLVKTDKNFEYKMPETYRGQYFECDGLEVHAKLRDRKSPGKLLSSPLTISAKVMNSEKNYKNKEGKIGKQVEEYHMMFDEGKIEKDSLNIFYFDKYRTRHITKGNYTTTFQRITEDLNWKFLKALKDKGGEQALQKAIDELFTSISEKAQKGAGEKIAAQTKEFFKREDYDQIKIDFFNLLWPFSDAFFALRKENSLSQIPVSKLGSGIEMVFTLLLLKSISEAAKGSIIYLIDEPEISLHPQAQKKLLSLLIEEAKDKQIIISTHSSYFIDPSLMGNIIRFKNEDEHIKTFSLDEKINNDVKENRNFFFRHRDLLFTDRAIFVEGVNDYEKYSKFCEINNFENLPKYFFMMNGCGSTLFFSKFCKSLGIKMCAIVDRDFAFQRSYWQGKDRKNFVKKMTDYAQEHSIAFDHEKLDETLSQEPVDQPRGGKQTAEEIDVQGTAVSKIVDEDIFVLKKGEINDYLDEHGAVIEEEKDEKQKEIIAIFAKIKEELTPSPLSDKS